MELFFKPLSLTESGDFVDLLCDLSWTKDVHSEHTSEDEVG